MYRLLKNLVVKNFPNTSRKVYHTINKFIYRGNNYYCPICERGYSRFLPGPDNIRSNSKCPGCSSLERHRLLWIYLTRELNILTSKLELLSAAPDYATQSKLKNLANIRYSSVDLESPLATYKADLTKLDFNNNSFDAILCYHVLEHIEDDKKAISELYRILKPGGWAILQSPIDTDREKTFEDFTITSSQERKKIFGQEDHVRIYGKDYSLRLKKEDFVVREDDFINKLSESEITKYVLDKNETIFFCKKPVYQ
ncbi:MAG: methyltransferase domain-containing protein [Ignavibacteriaceae bacterium]|nr:methyltransferase domain-containing protein [Ignavibacteriaceae bacterium]